MSDTGSGLKSDLKKSLSELQRLRDEIRVRLHLAGMDLKDQWNKLEPHLADVERKAADVSEASRTLLDEAVKKLEKFRASLH
jgi:predicted  nucleic acid-binding Zn-ribbon protein